MRPEPFADWGPRFFLLIAVFAGGCGYRFVAGASPLPEGIRTVSAPVFENRTPEPGLELLFTDSIRQQLIRSGVAARGKADAEIRGEVREVTGAPTLLVPGASLASYRMTVRARLKLMKGPNIVSEVDVDGSEDYLPGSDVLESEANRMAALRRVADQIVRDGYERLATGWATTR